MTLRTKHNNFNTLQINHWLNKTARTARTFRLDDNTEISIGDTVWFNGQAAKIPQGPVIIKELRVGIETHQVMAALEYNNDLFYYHICDFSGLPQQCEVPECHHKVVDTSPEPTASFNAYGLTEVQVKGTTYLLDGNELDDLNTHLYNLGVYRRATK